MAQREIARFSSGSGHAVGVALGWGADGEPLLVSSGDDGWEVCRWDIRTGDRVWCDGEGMSGCNSMALVPLSGGGVLLAVGTEDGIEWWNALTGQRRPGWIWEDRTIWDVSVGELPDGRPILLGAGHDGVMYRWDPVTGELLGTSPAGVGGGSTMAVGFVPSPDGAGLVVSGDEAGRISRWNAVDGCQVGEPILGHGSKVRILQGLFAAETHLFVSCDQQGELKRWNAVTGAQVGPAIDTGTDVYGLATASVGGMGVLFTAGADDTVRVWDSDTGESIGFSLRGTVVSALTQPDGTALLATSTAQGEIVVHACSLPAL
ncbi:WD40 repeat domain-containing protein [Streptomyces bobili]|uniref:WD40 repeat domain-containing protein n=1 Tax=Streptomyces bobili TaxID=67280 RepID=UPI001ABF14D4|nr:WD40 repeat domain-containing protein [Streptomyces bobili]